jgi:uncharacterized protein YqcC (DUF446 family)
MRQRIDVETLYAEAVRPLQATDPDSQFQAANPFTLDQLLAENWDALVARLAAAAG